MKFISLLMARRHAWKILPIAAVFAMVLAFSAGSAEASGDPYGDTNDGGVGIDGNAADVLGTPDAAFAQVGTLGTGGGSITVTFTDNVAFNGVGADIRVHAVNSGANATAVIEVSADGSTFVSAGSFSDAANADIDLGTLGLAFASAVRVTYSAGDFPGYNLDAIVALNALGEDTILDASPESAQGAGDTDHVVTANVSDDAVNLAGVSVRFAVTGGPNAGETATVVTNASGNAALTYPGDGGPGVDVIQAWLDLNGNGAFDANEPVDQVTMEWHGITGTIELTDLDGGTLDIGDVIEVTVDDSDLDTTAGADTTQVTVSSTTDGAGFVLTLTETGTSTGVFTGTFTLGAATDAVAKVLAAVDDDTITAAYVDAINGTGTGPQTLTDTLLVGAANDDDDEDGDAEEKVTICHMPPGNPGNAKTIEVGAPAEAAHLAHGDVLGDCSEVDLPPTKQEAQREAFCEARPDHPRCEDIEDESAESLEVESEEVETPSNSERDAALSAFCERKPDHKRCSDDSQETGQNRGRSGKDETE